MLKFLHIENIAVIEQSDIEFSRGFNAMTGETGAGKSIVIDAINAVLGERTSRELIRDGCDTAEVSAVFGDFDDHTAAMLSSHGFFPDEDGNLVIRRRLSVTGKGLIRINDRPVTATELKEIGRQLVNIHGQHDNQALLNPEQHLDFLDLMADNEEIKARYYAEFRELNRIRRELAEIETDEEEKRRRTELLKFQINELEAAAVRPGEYTELKDRLKIATDYQRTTERLRLAYTALNGNDDTDGALSLAASAQKALSSLKTDEWRERAAAIEEATGIIKEVSNAVYAFLDTSAFEEIDLDVLNSRLDTLERLMKKYGADETGLLDMLYKAQAELEATELSDKKATELSRLLDTSTERLISLGAELTEARQRAALDFEKRVCEILKYLNMPDVIFKTKLSKGRYTSRGCDTAEFMISANRGEAPKPLCKIASGGELSRVMLAIKSVLLDRDSVGTMIFDEIDSGISGYTAGKVAVQLKRVADNRQVICVTHLAQIAAVASTHLLIEKTSDGEHTFTGVSALSYKDRINEIARIMSGTEMTENLYNSARELLDRSNRYENL